MRLFGLFLLVLSFQSQASTSQCQLTEPVTVHLVGEIHGTQTSAELQSVLIPGALEDKIVMGIEIDPATLALKLNPRFANSLIAMEEPVSKGFALVMWAWRSVTWTKIKFEVGFARTYQNSDIQDAIASFAYFLGHYPQLQKAVKSARQVTLDADAKSDPDLKAILDKTDQIIAKPLEIDQAEILLPVTSLNSLTTLNRFFQEVAVPAF